MQFLKPNIEVVSMANNITMTSQTKKLPAFDLDLIETLENDHHQILDLYNNVLESANNKNFVKLQLLIVEFAAKFTDHIQTEDEKIYSYLNVLASNKSLLEQQIVAEFSTEMKNISSLIFSLLTQSPNTPINENNVESFTENFEKIGELISDRIEREENILYPIYSNSR